MINRLNETPPDEFPLKSYRAHPSISSDDLYYVGVDTGTKNLAITVSRISLNYKTKQRFFSIVEIIYPKFEIDKLDLYEKLDYISQLFWNLTRKYNIMAIVCELIGLETTSELKLGGLLYTHSVTTLIRQICFCNDIMFFELPVKKIKYCVTGNGNANKKEIQEAIDKMLDYQYHDLITKNDHIADSIAILYCYLHEYYQKESNK